MPDILKSAIICSIETAITLPDSLSHAMKLHKSGADPATQEQVSTCSIITTTPNELTAPIHDRMPVILPTDRRAAWLDAATPPEQLQTFLVPYPASEMEAYPISARVGSPKNDDPGIIDRLATTGDFLKETFPDPL